MLKYKCYADMVKCETEHQWIEFENHNLLENVKFGVRKLA